MSTTMYVQISNNMMCLRTLARNIWSDKKGFLERRFSVQKCIANKGAIRFCDVLAKMGCYSTNIFLTSDGNRGVGNIGYDSLISAFSWHSRCLLPSYVLCIKYRYLGVRIKLMFILTIYNYVLRHQFKLWQSR